MTRRTEIRGRYRRAYVVAWVLAVPALLVLALWWGSAREGSLALVLNLATRHAGAVGALQVQQVQGTLREGGRIGQLHWQQGSVRLQAQGVSLAWNWRDWVRGQMTLQDLHMDRLMLTLDAAGAPTQPLQSLVLPLALDLPFAVDDLVVQGATTVQAQGLRGHYRYELAADGSAGHRLIVSRVMLAQGRYQLDAQLQAQAPMALQGQLEGEVHTQLPGGMRIPLRAQARVQGQLAGGEALLQLQASLTGRGGAMPALQTTAQLRPWAPQPLSQVRLNLRDLNLADLWPKAPHTRLSGHADVQPLPGPAQWQARLALHNALEGPWDRQRLPLQQLQADGRYEAGQWQATAVQVRAGGGLLHAQGLWAPDATDGAPPWQGQVRWQHIRPSALHGALASWPVQGRLSARAQGTGSAFDLQLQPMAGAPASGRLQGLSLGELRARGVWDGPSVHLTDLWLNAAQARLQAQGLLDRKSLAFDGLVSLAFPGGQARSRGRLVWDMNPGDDKPPGGGELQITLDQAALAWRWLQSLSSPWTGPLAMGDWQTRGRGHLSLGWQGPLLHALRAALTPRGVVPDVQLQARLDLPELVLQPPDGAESLTLLDWQTRLDGPLSALSLKHQGRVNHGPWQAALTTQGELNLTQDWAGQVSLHRLALVLDDHARALTWQLVPPPSTTLQWRWRDGTVQLAPGQLLLGLRTKPDETDVRDASTVPLSWQQLAWGPEGLKTRGQLQNLPLAWLERLTGPGRQPLADAGLSGALWLQGDWALHWPRDGATPVSLQAQLRHQRGDLALALDEGRSAQTVSAGLREAVLQLWAQGPQLQARLRWDSERAGQLHAQVNTRLQAGPDGWHWPADAALSGQVQTQLPQMGVWSLLAPPGWRMRGVLQAQAELSGSRARPHWQGRVQGTQLALRSTVNGFEWVNGQLLARLEGDQLVIERFSVEGPGGVQSGGRLQAQGWARWRAASAGRQGQAEIDLQLQAERLRVSDRPDRRLVVSGALQSQLRGAQLRLRGALVADQAAFLLSDEVTPRLGGDVVIKGRAVDPVQLGPRVEPDVQIEVDLGKAFAVKGHGLDVVLQGRLDVRSTPGQAAPRLLGEVRTTRGSYRAYGADLDIEAGVLRFAGPYDNPQLDIVAVRPNLNQRVGVQVWGTVQAPVLRLVSEPELPDTEKLSWLVLGRSAAGPGGEAAILQQAALSLLGRGGKSLDQSLAGALGLDEVGLRTDANQPSLVLGKRLSSRLYVLYGQSLGGAVSTVSVFYDLSRRLTLRARAGESSAMELVFTLPYD